MSSLNIHLPDSLNNYLHEQMKRCGFKDASEFLANLIESDRARKKKVEIESMLLEAVDGPFSEWSDEDVEDIRRTGRRLIDSRRSK